MSEPTKAAGREHYHEGTRCKACHAEARAAALPHLEAVARSMREWLAVSGDAPATEHRAAIGAWLASTDAAIDALRERSGDLTAAQKSAALMSLITERERSGE